jgi:hypothetical protein
VDVGDNDADVHGVCDRLEDALRLSRCLSEICRRDGCDVDDGLMVEACRASVEAKEKEVAGEGEEQCSTSNTSRNTN